jgi:hypothetical protein
MDLENCNSQMAQFIMGHFIIMIFRVAVFMCGLTTKSTKEIGLTTKCMAMDT